MTKYVAVGYIFSVRGLKGEVKVKPLTENNRFSPGNKLYLIPPTEEHQTLTVQETSPAGKNLSVKFEQIKSIDDAEKLKGHYLEILQEKLPQGTYYTDDLIGLQAFTDEGKNLGKVTDILTTKAHDILVVTGLKKLHIPITKQHIKNIDMRIKTITVVEEYL